MRNTYSIQYVLGVLMLILLMMFMLMFMACEPKLEKNVAAKSGRVHAVVVPSKYGGFGYDIFIDSVLTIHQPHVPGVFGVYGFASRDDARKVADLVIQKIKKGEMPPSLSTDELDNLSIQY